MGIDDAAGAALMVDIPTAETVVVVFEQLAANVLDLAST